MLMNQDTNSKANHAAGNRWKLRGKLNGEKHQFTVSYDSIIACEPKDCTLGLSDENLSASKTLHPYRPLYNCNAPHSPRQRYVNMKIPGKKEIDAHGLETSSKINHCDTLSRLLRNLCSAKKYNGKNLKMNISDIVLFSKESSSPNCWYSCITGKGIVKLPKANTNVKSILIKLQSHMFNMYNVSDIALILNNLAVIVRYNYKRFILTYSESATFLFSGVKDRHYPVSLQFYVPPKNNCRYFATVSRPMCKNSNFNTKILDCHVFGMNDFAKCYPHHAGSLHLAVDQVAQTLVDRTLEQEGYLMMKQITGILDSSKPAQETYVVGLVLEFICDKNGLLWFMSVPSMVFSESVPKTFAESHASTQVLCSGPRKPWKISTAENAHGKYRQDERCNVCDPNAVNTVDTFFCSHNTAESRSENSSIPDLSNSVSRPPLVVSLCHRVVELEGKLMDLHQKHKNTSDQLLSKNEQLHIFAEQILELKKQNLKQGKILNDELMKAQDTAQSLKDKIIVQGKTIEDTAERENVLQRQVEEARGKIEKISKNMCTQKTHWTAQIEERDMEIKNRKEFMELMKLDLQNMEVHLTAQNKTLKFQQKSIGSLQDQTVVYQEKIRELEDIETAIITEKEELEVERNALFRNQKEKRQLIHGRGQPFELFVSELLSVEQNPDAELEIIYSIFQKYYIKLKRIFVSYATRMIPLLHCSKYILEMSDDNQNMRLMMTLTNWRNFMTDLAVIDAKQFPPGQVDVIFCKSITGDVGNRTNGFNHVRSIFNENNCCGSVEKNDCPRKMCNSMTIRDFLEGLLRAAYYRFPSIQNVADRLQHFLSHYVLMLCLSDPLN